MPHGLSRIEWIKDPGQIFLGYAYAGVGYGYPNLIILTLGPDGYCPLFGNGLRRVHKEIHEDLIYLGRNTLHRGYGIILSFQFSLKLYLVPNEVQCAIQSGTEIGRLPFCFADAGEISKVQDYFAHSRRAFDRFIDQAENIAAQIVKVDYNERLAETTSFMVE